MHPAVELLINRMKSNPDDFKGNSRWLQAFNDYKKHFSKDDLIAAEHAYKEMRMVQFQGRLFDLMTQEEKKREEVDLTMAPIAMSGQAVSYASNVGTSFWSAHDEELAEIKRDLELLREKGIIEMENELNNTRL